VVARVYTDPEWLAAFEADPAAFAARHGEAVARLLGGVDRTRLSVFARSLTGKRAREIRRFLPFTTRALGGLFAAAFARHASLFVTAGTRKPLADAMAFAHGLARSPEVARPTREAARFDYLWQSLSFRLDRRGGRPAACAARPRRGVWLRFSRFGYEFPALPACGTGVVAGEPRWPERPTIVMFVRVPGWSGVWYW
jgi:hypothetical protein